MFVEMPAEVLEAVTVLELLGTELWQKCAGASGAGRPSGKRGVWLSLG